MAKITYDTANPTTQPQPQPENPAGQPHVFHDNVSGEILALSQITPVVGTEVVLAENADGSKGYILASGLGGAGGGHVIKNVEGATLPTQTALRFFGAEVVDEGGETRTKGRITGVLDSIPDASIRAEVLAYTVDITDTNATEHNAYMGTALTAASGSLLIEPGRYMMGGPLILTNRTNTTILANGAQLYTHPGFTDPSDPDALYPGASTTTATHLYSSGGTDNVTVIGLEMNGNYVNIPSHHCYNHFQFVDANRVTLKDCSFTGVHGGNLRFDGACTYCGIDGGVYGVNAAGSKASMYIWQKSFTGTGLDDLLVKATVTRGWSNKRRYQVKIVSVSPGNGLAYDEFVWRRQTGPDDATWDAWGPWTTTPRAVPAGNITWYQTLPGDKSEWGYDPALYEDAQDPLIWDSDNLLVISNVVATETELTNFGDERSALLSGRAFLSVAWESATGHTVDDVWEFRWAETRTGALNWYGDVVADANDCTAKNNFLINAIAGQAPSDIGIGGFIYYQSHFRCVGNKSIDSLSMYHCNNTLISGNQVGYIETGDQYNLNIVGNTHREPAYLTSNAASSMLFLQYGIHGCNVHDNTFEEFGVAGRYCAILLKVTTTTEHSNISIVGNTFHNTHTNRVYFGLNLWQASGYTGLGITGDFEYRDNRAIGETTVDCNDAAYVYIKKPKMYQKYGLKHSGSFVCTTLDDGYILLTPAAAITDDIQVARGAIAALSGFGTGANDGDFQVLKVNKALSSGAEVVTSILLTGSLTGGTDTCTEIYFPLQIVANTDDEIDWYLDTWTVEDAVLNVDYQTPGWRYSLRLIQNADGTGRCPVIPMGNSSSLLADIKGGAERVQNIFDDSSPDNIMAAHRIETIIDRKSDPGTTNQIAYNSSGGVYKYDSFNLKEINTGETVNHFGGGTLTSELGKAVFTYVYHPQAVVTTRRGFLSGGTISLGAEVTTFLHFDVYGVSRQTRTWQFDTDAAGYAIGETSINLVSVYDDGTSLSHIGADQYISFGTDPNWYRVKTGVTTTGTVEIYGGLLQAIPAAATTVNHPGTSTLDVEYGYRCPELTGTTKYAYYSAGTGTPLYHAGYGYFGSLGVNGDIDCNGDVGCDNVAATVDVSGATATFTGNGEFGSITIGGAPLSVAQSTVSYTDGQQIASSNNGKIIKISGTVSFPTYPASNELYHIDTNNAEASIYSANYSIMLPDGSSVSAPATVTFTGARQYRLDASQGWVLHSPGPHKRDDHTDDPSSITCTSSTTTVAHTPSTAFEYQTIVLNSSAQVNSDFSLNTTTGVVTSPNYACRLHIVWKALIVDAVTSPGLADTYWADVYIGGTAKAGEFSVLDIAALKTGSVGGSVYVTVAASTSIEIKVARVTANPWNQQKYGCKLDITVVHKT